MRIVLLLVSILARPGTAAAVPTSSVASSSGSDAELDGFGQSLDELEALDLLEPSASEPDMERPVWERGWFWGLVAAVGVGAAVGAAAAVVSDRQELICVGSAGVDCSGGL